MEVEGGLEDKVTKYSGASVQKLDSPQFWSQTELSENCITFTVDDFMEKFD